MKVDTCLSISTLHDEKETMVHGNGNDTTGDNGLEGASCEAARKRCGTAEITRLPRISILYTSHIIYYPYHIIRGGMKWIWLVLHSLFFSIFSGCSGFCGGDFFLYHIRRYEVDTAIYALSLGLFPFFGGSEFLW